MIPVNRENLRDALIGAAVAAVLAWLLSSCAAQSLPPPTSAPRAYASAPAPDANLNRTHGDVLIKAVRARYAGTLIMSAMWAAAQIITPRAGMRELYRPNDLSS
jgi:hypothetical protein